MEKSKKPKFDSKLYYLKNKERILNYNRAYFKEYYKKKKQSLFNPDMNKSNETYDEKTNNLTIEKNVRVYF